MTHDPKLVEHLVEHLQLLDPAFAVEILAAIDASRTHWVAPQHMSVAMKRACGWSFDEGLLDDGWQEARDAYLAARRGGADAT